MSDPSEENLTVARTVADVLGGNQKVTRYHDNDRKSYVDILIAAEAPQPGVTSYSTIGLSDAPLYQGAKEFAARVELVGACSSAFQGFPGILATAAFCIMNSHWFCAPGIIFPEALAQHNGGSPMKHLMFVPPFLWDDLKTIRFPSKTVAWLLAVPISDKELRLAEKEGPKRLEEVFEIHQIDIFDPNRRSVV
jgi:antitoxin YqcF